MRKYFLALCLPFVLLFAALAQAGTIKEYSADMVDVSSGKTLQKMYVTEQRIRFDGYGEDGKLEGISIFRIDKGVMYAVQVEGKVYFEIPLDKNVKSIKDFAETGMMGIKPDIKREKEGSETVNGYAAEKFKVTTTVELMGQKNVITHHEWVAPEFDPLPVRAQSEPNGKITEMRNIKEGAPEDSVFEVPEGYQKGPDMTEMMKGAQQQ